jgi:RNA polymerase sigma-70 factor (ECF subfamily)
LHADEDALLMLAFRAGDTAAFETLFRRWAGPLLRYLERMLRDAGAAEELVQEAFLRVHRARDSYRAEARFSTWLYRIGTNLALNELRKPGRRVPHASVEGEDWELLAGCDPASDDVAHARRGIEAVDRALASLPERQRAALWLVGVEGHSYAEAAETLEITQVALKALVHRAREQLGARLAKLEKGAEPEDDES